MASELSSDQLLTFRQQLKQRYDELLAEIRQGLLDSQDQHYIDLAGRVHDREEESVADLLVDLELAERDRHIQEIRNIEAARLRLRTGTYGECVDCGEPIAAERLAAYPTAERCIECQTRYEKTYAQNGRPSL
jgi:RNA polymerase-binding protein DksA